MLTSHQWQGFQSPASFPASPIVTRWHTASPCFQREKENTAWSRQLFSFSDLGRIFLKNNLGRFPSEHSLATAVANVCFSIRSWRDYVSPD